MTEEILAANLKNFSDKQGLDWCNPSPIQVRAHYLSPVILTIVAPPLSA
jgi:hypothetical protein